MGTFVVWVLCTAVVLVALLFGRTSNLHRRLRLTDLDWRAALILAAIAGAVPAFIYQQLSRPTVELPPAVSDQPILPPR